jgi:hypothetical protein
VLAKPFELDMLLNQVARYAGIQARAN